MRETIEQSELEDLIKNTFFMHIDKEDDNEMISNHCVDLADMMSMIIEKYISEELVRNEVKILFNTQKKETYSKLAEILDKEDLRKTVDEIFSQLRSDINHYIDMNLL